MTAIIIWLIGWLFSCAYMGVVELKGWKRFAADFLMFLSWPIQLGCWLREQRSSNTVLSQNNN